MTRVFISSNNPVLHRGSCVILSFLAARRIFFALACGYNGGDKNVA